MNHSRVLTLALVALVAVATLAPAAVAPVAAGADTGASLDSDASPQPALAAQEDPDNETSEENTTDDGDTEPHPDAPDFAETFRFSPVDFGEDYLSVETVDAEAEYHTEGPFAAFATSQPLDSVRIEQSSADATLLDGDHAVVVDYEDDAAPDDNQSYYGLELFFADGSSETVDLYASETDVSVAAAELEAYEGLIDRIEADAEAEGYEANPDGAESYYDWTQDRIEILDNLLAERAAELFGLAMAAAMNPLAWILFFGTIAIAAYRRESVHGRILDMLENSVGEADRKERDLVRAYEEAAITADEEALTKLDAIGPQQAAYWKDTFGVTSVRQLAELAHRGRQVRADGGELTQPHDGVDSLHADELEGSWLEPILRSHRLSTPREALSHLRAALVRMDSKHGMGHRYRETRTKTEELLSETNPNGGAGGVR